MIEEKRKIRYLLPTRIVAKEGPIENAETLLKEKDDQAYLSDPEKMIINGPGFIVLDFGRELCGGIRIITNIQSGQKEGGKIRIRFGESVSETYSDVKSSSATNNHALRDFETELVAFADESFGNTGFRFVRIDFLEKSTTFNPIKNIYAKEYYHDYKPVKSFHSNDELLNQIYETCVHTITLCMQNRIWDGIKRDRLVWIGDMEPEIHAILHVYGNVPLIEETIKTAVISNPMPCWINNIPSYSTWFLLIMYDIYMYQKDAAFIDRYKDYIDAIIDMVDKSIKDDGSYDVYWSKDICPIAMPYFIDWPTYTDDNEKERKDACEMLIKYAVPKVLEMYKLCNYEVAKLENIERKLKNVKFAVPSTKVFAAFYQLLHKDDESFKVLVDGGAKGMSTFMSYYILKAVAQKDKQKAFEMLKTYYGGMLSRGATSFWEDFHIEWLEGSSRIDELPKPGEKDLHGDFGGYCYVGFRHSLCHGWSSGPISFIFEEYK